MPQSIGKFYCYRSSNLPLAQSKDEDRRSRYSIFRKYSYLIVLIFVLEITIIQVLGENCSTDPCMYGLCLDNENSSYSCYCIDGYTGVNCEVNWDECWSNPCLNGGTCNDAIAAYNCTCAEGFVGLNCEQKYSECSNQPCLNNGTCVDYDGFTCQCPDGYSGDYCEIDAAVCNDTICQNLGVCVEGPGFQFSCRCAEGWTGKVCDEDIDECLSLPCNNGGLCINLPSTYSCACLFGFTGKNCDKIIVPCPVNICENGAVCLLEDDEPTCYCVPDYHGVHCQFKYDDCESKSARCENGGTCIDGINSFTCSCPPSFTGEFCELFVFVASTSSTVRSRDLDYTTDEVTTLTSDYPKSSLPPVELTTTSILTSTMARSTSTTLVPFWTIYGNFTSTIEYSPPETTFPIQFEWNSTAITAKPSEDSVTTTDLLTTVGGGERDVTNPELWTPSGLSDVPITVTFESKTDITTIKSHSVTDNSTRSTELTTEPIKITSIADDTSLYSIADTTVEGTTDLTPTIKIDTTENILGEKNFTTPILRVTTEVPIETTYELSSPSLDGSTVTAFDDKETTRYSIFTQSTTATVEEEITGPPTIAHEEVTTVTILPDQQPDFQNFTTDSLFIPSVDRATVADYTTSPLTSTIGDNDQSSTKIFVSTTSVSSDCSGEKCVTTSVKTAPPVTTQCECSSQDCSISNDITNAAFSGKSYARHRVTVELNNSGNATLKIYLKLRTYAKDGIIFHVYFDDERYALLYSELGTLKFQFSCGLQTMLLGEIDTPIDNGFVTEIETRFQYFVYGRVNKCNARLLVNGTTAVSGEQILSSSISVPHYGSLHIGGIPLGFSHNFPHVVMGFIGCMNDLKVNNVAKHFVRDSIESVQIENCKSLLCLSNPCKNFGACDEVNGVVRCTCVAGYTGELCERSACDDNPCHLGATCISSPGTGFVCVCPLGSHGLLCEEDTVVVRPSFSVFIPGFSSYVAYGISNSVKDSMELKMRIIPRNLEQVSLIAYLGQSGAHRELTDHLSITYVRGYIMLTWDLGSGVRRIFTTAPITEATYVTATASKGYKPYTLRVGRRGREAWLAVDGIGNVTGRAAGPMFRLDVSPILYIGGHKSRNFELLPHDLPLHSGFSGCIFDIELRTDDTTFQITSNSPATGRGVGECHRNECVRHFCKNGAVCLNHGPTYSCICTKDWTGVDCSTPIANYVYDNVVPCSPFNKG